VTAQQFKASLSQPALPAGISDALVALWHEGRGDWETAHRVAQDISDRTGAWVHAYLHRKEGDLSNAAYWYRVAGQKMPEAAHADEWLEIVTALLPDA
jgi:hypothetical protein